MEYQIQHNPSYSVVEVTLQSGETIVGDSGAMAWMDANVRTETSTRGGMWKGLKRKIFSGESFFQNTYTAEGGEGMVAFTPGSAGAVVALKLEGSDLLLEKGAYLASESGVTCDAKYSGLLKGFFNEGMFILKCSGTGTLFFHAYGDIQEVSVDGEYLVDNGFAVAWEPSLDYSLTRARKIRSFLFSDQLLLRFKGRGRLWVQSRSPRSLASWVHPFRPVKAKSNN
jgi:uncharacterized protein (TIGR00266 family)